jgi:hypothetical protein
MPIFDDESLKRAASEVTQPPQADYTQDTKPVGAWPYAAMTLGNMADLGTTLYALKSGKGKEGNPAMKGLNTPGMVAAKVAETALIAYAMRELQKNHKTTAAKILGYTLGGAMGALATNNMRVIR